MEAARSSRRAISRSGESEAIPREMSSRSASVSASPRTATSSGRNAAARQQHRANAAMWLVKGAPNLMQRLSRLPTGSKRSRFSIAESPNRCPALMPTPPLHSRLTSDGVASTRFDYCTRFKCCIDLRFRCTRVFSLSDKSSPPCTFLKFPITAFYKEESQEKRLPGDWKEQRFLPGSPAQVMLGRLSGFSFFAESCCCRDDAFGF